MCLAIGIPTTSTLGLYFLIVILYMVYKCIKKIFLIQS